MQRTIFGSVIRGGTSRGVFIRLEDLPAPGSHRDRFLLEILGSPDPIQVDGLGGGHSHTSKAMAVGPSTEPGVDVDYLFAQVDVRRPIVDYGGNCGNLTAAVGVYALNENLVDRGDGNSRELVLRCLNTDSRVRVQIPLVDGIPKVQGEFRMSGVARPGAEIRVDYLDPAGAMLGRGALPLGEPTSRITASGVGDLEVSIVDVTSPLVILAADAIGLAPPFLPEALNEDKVLLERVESIRGEAARLLGMVADAASAVRTTPAQPKVAMCAPPSDYETSNGELILGSQVELLATMSSMQRIHHAFAGTGAMCLAAAARIPGTVAARHARATATEIVRIGHPKGVAQSTVSVDTDADGTVRVLSVGVSRTARTIMRGEIYHRRSDQDTDPGAPSQ